jgi:hypothetical protein
MLKVEALAIDDIYGLRLPRDRTGKYGIGTIDYKMGGRAAVLLVYPRRRFELKNAYLTQPSSQSYSPLN